MNSQAAIAAQGFRASTRELALGGLGPSLDLFIEDPADRTVAVQGVGFDTRKFALNGFDLRRRRIVVGRSEQALPGRRRRDEDALLFMLLR